MPLEGSTGCLRPVFGRCFFITKRGSGAQEPEPIVSERIPSRSPTPSLVPGTLGLHGSGPDLLRILPMGLKCADSYSFAGVSRNSGIASFGSSCFRTAADSLESTH